MNKKYFRSLIFMLGLLISGSATAGFTVAKIRSILVTDQADMIYIFPVGGVRDAPSCHGSNGDYLSFSMKRPRAKEYYAGLLTAFYAEKTVVLRGTGGCEDQSMSETLLYFEIQ